MIQKTRRPTLKDIAAAAELSVAAVSLALRNSPNLPRRTIERVKRHASELGYAPDPALSALAAYRTRIRENGDFSVIGLVSNWSAKDAWTKQPGSRQFIEAATAKAEELGYSLQHFWARQDGATPACFNRILETRGIRGLILAPFENPGDELPLNWSRYSVVTIERPHRYPLFHHIDQDHFSVLLAGFEKLLQRGYTRVGLVLKNSPGCLSHRQRKAAYRFALSESNGRLQEIPPLEIDADTKLAEIRKWLREHQPEAVVSDSPLFRATAQAEGLSIPDDLGYVSLDVDADSPETTGIDHRSQTKGIIAVEAINALIQKNQCGFSAVPTGTTLDCAWKEGNTLPPLPIVNAIPFMRPPKQAYPVAL